MAVIENNSLMKYKDGSGNVHLIYPITTADNVDGLPVLIDEAKKIDIGVTTAGTGDAYTANVPGLTALTAGISITIVPHVVSTTVSPTLNINGLGAKSIRRPISGSAATVPGSAPQWLTANKAVHLTYDGRWWVTDDAKPNVNDLYGDIPGPKVTRVTLTSTGWSSAKVQTVTVNGVVADESKQVIQPMPTIASQSAYGEAGIVCTGQAANSVTFTAATIPTTNIDVYIAVQAVRA